MVTRHTIWKCYRKDMGYRFVSEQFMFDVNMVKALYEEFRLEESFKNECLTCRSWKQFNTTTGYCDDTIMIIDETKYDHWCSKWRQKDEERNNNS
jgi:hypothetical protein